MLSTVAVLALAAGTGGWLVLRDGDTEAAAAQPTTASVATSTLRTTVTASGTLAAAESADESFAVAGTVTDVLVAPGDLVAVGQALAVVDDTTLQAELDAAESALDAAEAAADEGGSDLQAAAAAAQVTSAETALGTAQDAVEDATLRATVAGTVTAVDLEVGDTVGSSSSSGGSGGAGASMGGSSPTGTTSTTTTTDAGSISIVSTGRSPVDATVSADDVAQVTSGLQVELSAADVADTVYGTVADVAVLPTVDDSGAATFPVTVEVTGTRDDLYAGVSVDLAIIVSQRDDVLTVSSAAVQTDEEGATYVDRVTATDDDGDPTDTERVDIEIGDVSGTATEVVAGLSEGDVVEVPGVSLPAGDGGAGGMGGAGGGFGEGGFPGGGQMPDFSQMPGGGR